MLTKWCVAFMKLSFLIVFICYFFEFLDIKINKTGRSFDELPFAEGILVIIILPKTILLKLFIYYYQFNYIDI